MQRFGLRFATQKQMKACLDGPCRQTKPEDISKMWPRGFRDDPPRLESGPKSFKNVSKDFRAAEPRFEDSDKSFWRCWTKVVRNLRKFVAMNEMAVAKLDELDKMERWKARRMDHIVTQPPANRVSIDTRLSNKPHDYAPVQ